MSDEYILGVSAYYHDSAAALLKNGVIVAAAQEERFSRKKHDERFPVNAVRYVLEEAGCSLGDVSAVAFYDKPFLKFERLLETYHSFAPKGFTSFMASMPVWLKEKIFLRREIKNELSGFLGDSGGQVPPLLFPEHHLSHAASAFFPSPFEEAAILTVDGVGEWATTTIGHGKGNSITMLRELHFPHSLGLLYSAFTAYCGFKVNSGEYKLMGLAPYGNPESEKVREHKAAIYEHLVDVREDGSFLLNMDYFEYATGLRMYVAPRWERLFGVPARPPESEGLEQEYMDIALAIQQVTEELVLRLAKTALDITGCRNLCMAGGVALNCVANGKLLESGMLEGLWVQPASGDAGGALGAALAAHHIHNGAPRRPEAGDSMRGSYYGPAFGEKSVAAVCLKYGAPFVRHADEESLCSAVAEKIASGYVVGWFQGRMEYGPRALGNRSIVADPRSPEMQKKLNLKIKYREGFRPFAPSVLEEEVSQWFDLHEPSPYMLLVAPVAEKHRSPLPEGYFGLGLWDRLYVQRSSIPAVTHVDYSGRVQTVSRATNPRYWALIKAFQEKTGVPLLVNTSFNVRGEPIVCTPEDAYACFMRTEMDYLVLGDCVLDKKEQPVWQEKRDWKELFQAD